jgi:hypothetical protein
MNFEFESTFNNAIIPFFWKSVCDLIRSIDHAFWIASINILAFVITASLYLQNYLIPGTYGAGPNGDVWVDALLMLARVWTITTSYSLLRLAYLCNSDKVYQILSMIRVRIQKVITQSRNIISVIILQTIVLANLILKEPRQPGRYRNASALNSLTHINVILTVY